MSILPSEFKTLLYFVHRTMKTNSKEIKMEVIKIKPFTSLYLPGLWDKGVGIVFTGFIGIFHSDSATIPFGET